MFSVLYISPIYIFTVFMCFIIFYLSLSFLALMHFYHVFIACSLYSFRYVYHIFMSYISYSSTCHLIYYLSNGSYYISYSVHVICLYIYYFHGYILYTICYVLFSCTVSMYCDHINFSDHFAFLYFFIYHVRSYNLMLQNLSSHSSAMLLISYHIFPHVIFKSFILCFMPVNTKEVDKGNL